MRLLFEAIEIPNRAPAEFNSNNTMKHITKLSFTSVLAAVLGTAGLTAQTEPARNQGDEAIHQLPEYIVSANTYAVPRTEVGSTVNTLSREELELGQTTFVLDALRELPGVWFRSNGGPGSAATVTTRGLPTAASPIILIDGIEVGDPSTGSMFNPGTLFSNSVERVEFLKGAQSALYGANALAGVINIETRKVKDGETHGSLSGGLGTFDTRQIAADLQTQQGAFDFSISLNQYDSDGFSTSAGNNEEDGYKNNSLHSKLGYQVSENLKLYSLLYYIETESDIDSAAANPFGYSESEQLFVNAGALIQPCEAWDSQVSYAFSKTRSYSMTNLGGSDSDGDRHKVEWRNHIRLNESWNLAAGAQYELEDRRSDPGERDESSYYADNTFEVAPDFFVTLGGRFDDNSAYGQNETWRSTFSYHIDPIQSRLHGSFGTTFQAPTFLQTIGKPAWGVAANPNLKAEDGEAWDLGLEHTFAEGRIICDITAFGNEITNKIDYSAGQYINVADYKSYGVESSVSWQVDRSLLLQANYTYTRAEADGTTALRVPKNMFNLSASWATLEGRLQLKPSVQYIDKRNEYGGAIAKSYTIVNLAGQYALNDQVTLWTRVNNLLNRDYQEINGYNSADFNIMTGLRIEF